MPTILTMMTTIHSNKSKIGSKLKKQRVVESIEMAEYKMMKAGFLFSFTILLTIATTVVLGQSPNDRFNQPAQDPGGRQLTGFAETPWMSNYSQVKDRFSSLSESKAAVDRIEILNAVRNQTILIRRNDVMYRYNFYKTPYEILKLTNHDLQKDEYEEAEAVLFQVKIIQPFLEAAAVNKKLEAAYGPRTRSTVKKETQKGADIWELEGGFIFQWYEPLKGHPYTRTIDYINDEMARRILDERKEYFTAEETDLLQKMIVR